MGGFFMGMAFLLEPWWPLGDKRWGYFALACLICVILTYLIPDEPQWLIRAQNSAAWRMFGPRLAAFLHAKGSDERAAAEFDMGWEEQGEGEDG
ncbi:MAG: hypothetical protein F4Y47_19040 [Acidobacteriia bacterium]|nr:hypothetical protein [Terriglobia bacterium]